ncbi:MAG: hypothetical protein K0R26_188 [Bacteroidota bacterium]|jgi:hypothetical protein|nr:hypothetical protein [Bacteroidota bacterium]
MNALFSILLKNLILLALVVISLVFIFTQYIGYREVRYVFLGLGILYVLASCLEAYVLSTVKHTTTKFTYFPDGLIAKRVIKIIAFVVIGVLLFYSGSIIRYMAFICFLIAFTEIAVTLWRRMKNLCFVALEDDQLIISTNKIETTTAKEIQKIETRHGLTYFVNYSGKAITLRTDMMESNLAFKSALDSWIISNHLSDKVIPG